MKSDYPFGQSNNFFAFGFREGTNLKELSPSEMSDHSRTVWGLFRAADEVGLVIKTKICKC